MFCLIHVERLNEKTSFMDGAIVRSYKKNNYKKLTEMINYSNINLFRVNNKEIKQLVIPSLLVTQSAISV